MFDQTPIMSLASLTGNDIRLQPGHSSALAFDPPLPPNAGPELMRFKLICPIDNFNNMTSKVYCSAKKEWHDTNANVELDSITKSFWGSSKGMCIGTTTYYCCGSMSKKWLRVLFHCLPTAAALLLVTMNLELNVWLRRDEWVKVHEARLDRVIRDNWNVIAHDTTELGNCGAAFLRQSFSFFHVLYMKVEICRCFLLERRMENGYLDSIQKLRN
ncbi:hypothetical protein Syun_018127 [Stephania yunnanensis]|uniref:Uncharacterized protein n=1 Tax=Stephania yunnanensis TaxID=152371 RepID=A0AAP0ISR5_9MAGN